jgi:MFS family permease
MFFIAWATSSLVIPRISDLKGRKNIFIISVFAQIIVITALTFSRSIYVTMCLLPFIGAIAVGRWTIGYIYLLENLPTDFQKVMGPIAQACGVFPLILGTLIT